MRNRLFLHHGDIAGNSVVANAGLEGLQAIMARGGKIIGQPRQWLACSCLGLFSQVTTYETESSFLLIEVFRKLINPQIEGHLDHIQMAFPIYQGI